MSNPKLKNVHLAEDAYDMGLDARSAQVRDFHRAMGQPILTTPQVPPEDRVRLRLRLIAEEFFELLEAAGVDRILDGRTALASVQASVDCFAGTVDLPEFADALADLDYVIEGTRLEFGIDGQPIADAVHASNMAKVGGAIDEHGKCQKPPGWQPPDIAGELRKQGWEG